MKNRVAIVTGGTRGIGAAMTDVLAPTVRTSQPSMRAITTQPMLSAARDRAGFIGEHSPRRHRPTRLLPRLAAGAAKLGRIDCLVNNAGFLVENNAFRMTDDEWNVALPSISARLGILAQAVLEPMAEAGYGRIVNVGSVTAAMGSPVEIGYGAAKAGLVGLTRSLARAVARKGITVNLVVPGDIRNRHDTSMRPEAQEVIRGHDPDRPAGRSCRARVGRALPARRARRLRHRLRRHR